LAAPICILLCRGAGHLKTHAEDERQQKIKSAGYVGVDKIGDPIENGVDKAENIVVILP
jgi:hypothetical protein